MAEAKTKATAARVGAFYVTRSFAKHDALIAKLGKHKNSGSCLHIKRLADDLGVLEQLIAGSVKAKRAQRTD